MNIGENIFTLRRAKHWTQAELGEKLGVSDQAVSKWENGQTAPDVSLFPLLARLFEVSIDRLFGYESYSYDAEVQEILAKVNNCGSTREEIALLTDGLARYPNSAPLKTALAFSLLILYRISEDEAARRSALDRAVSLCRDVTATC
ncbi:MAG: helix-turn-helix transcriptional regulator, partial [Clostridia bacterium]|nr:helix-turn-helix transcriptional regulator [Clostridia bacterium]